MTFKIPARFIAGFIAELILVLPQLEQADDATRALSDFGGQGCLLGALKKIYLLNLSPYFPVQHDAFLWLVANSPSLTLCWVLVS